MLKKIIKILLLIIVSIIIIIAVRFYFHPSGSLDFYISEDERSLFVQGINFYWVKEISGTTSDKGFGLEWAPDKIHLAFTDAVRESPEREYFIKIINLRTLNIKTVFIGNDHTNNFKWLDNNTIRVFVGAGSGVRVYKDINIHRSDPLVFVEDVESEDWILMKIPLDE